MRHVSVEREISLGGKIFVPVLTRVGNRTAIKRLIKRLIDR